MTVETTSVACLTVVRRELHRALVAYWDILQFTARRAFYTDGNAANWFLGNSFLDEVSD